MINKIYAKRYCNENIADIENFDLATRDDEMWVCHHRLEIRPFCKLSKQELVGLELYYKRPSSELIFMPLSEHRVLHTKGRKLSEEQVLNIKQRMTGNKLSEETKRKISIGVEFQKKYIMCVETGEVHCGNEWRKLGFDYARKVANGQYKQCKGKTFVFV